MPDNTLVFVISEDTARKALRMWCKDKKVQITHYFSCAKFNYSDEIFWAIVARLFGFDSSYNGVYGFHITEVGEVKLIGRMAGYGE